MRKIQKFKEGVHYTIEETRIFTEDFLDKHFFYDASRNMFVATKDFTIEFSAKLIEDEER